MFELFKAYATLAITAPRGAAMTRHDGA